MDRDELLRRRAAMASDLAALEVQRHRVDAQLALLDVLLGDGAEDAAPEPPKPAHRPPLAPPAKPPRVEEARAPAPKADRAGAKLTYRELAPALLGGPRRLVDLVNQFQSTVATVGAILRESPTWFRKVGAGPNTKWELTEEARAAANRGEG